MLQKYFLLVLKAEKMVPIFMIYSIYLIGNLVHIYDE